MKPFKAFCKRYATPDIVKINDDAEIPKMYAEATMNVVNDIKDMKDNFDTVVIAYIETFLDEIKDYESALRFTEGDIPDGVMSKVAHKLYDKSFNACDVDEQAVVKTVSVYIVIAVNDSQEVKKND